MTAPAALATGHYALVPERCVVRFTARWAGPGTPLRGRLTVRHVVAEQEVEILEIDGDTTVRARARVDRRAFPVGPTRGPIGRRVDVELEIGPARDRATV